MKTDLAEAIQKYTEIRRNSPADDATMEDRVAHRNQLREAHEKCRVLRLERDATSDGLKELEGQRDKLTSQLDTEADPAVMDSILDRLESLQSRLDEANRMHNWQRTASQKATRYRKNLKELSPEDAAALNEKQEALNFAQARYDSTVKQVEGIKKVHAQTSKKLETAKGRNQVLTSRYHTASNEEQAAIDAYSEAAFALVKKHGLRPEAALSVERSVNASGTEGIDTFVNRDRNLTSDEAQTLRQIAAQTASLRLRAEKANEKANKAATALRKHTDEKIAPLKRQLLHLESEMQWDESNVSEAERALHEAKLVRNYRAAWLSEGLPVSQFRRMGRIDEASTWPKDEGYIYLPASDGFPHGRMERIERGPNNELLALHGAKVTKKPTMPGDIKLTSNQNRNVFYSPRN